MLDSAMVAAIRMSLADHNFLVRHVYAKWESAFFEYWGCEPAEPDQWSALLKQVLQGEGVDPLKPVGFHVAARAFHVMPLRFKGQHGTARAVKFIDDFDHVAPALTESFDEDDWKRIEQQDDMFHGDKQPGDIVFDMGKREKK